MPLELSEAADGCEARAGMAVAPAPAATIPAPVICRKLRRPILDSSGPMGRVLPLLSRRQRHPLEQVPPGHGGLSASVAVRRMARALAARKRHAGNPRWELRLWVCPILLKGEPLRVGICDCGDCRKESGSVSVANGARRTSKSSGKFEATIGEAFAGGVDRVSSKLIPNLSR